MRNPRGYSRQSRGESKSSSSSQYKRSSSRGRHDDKEKDNWRDRQKQPYRKNFQFPPKSTQELGSKSKNQIQNKQKSVWTWTRSESCMNLRNNRQEGNEAQYNDLKDQINDLKRQLESEKSFNQDTNTDLKVKIELKNTMIRNLETQKTRTLELAKQESNLTIAESHIKDQINHLQSQLESEKDIIRDLKVQIELKDTMIRNLEFDSDTVADLKVKLKIKDEMIKSLWYQKDSNQTEISTLKNELQNLKDQSEDEKLKSQINIAELNKNIQSLQEQGEKDKLISQENISTLNKTIQNLSEEAKNKKCIHQENIASLNEKIRNLTEQGTAQNDIDQDKINNLMSNKERLLKDLEEFRIKHDESVKQHSNEKLALESDIAQIKLEKIDLHKRASASIDHWRQKLSDSESNSIKNMADLQTSLANLSKDKESLETNLTVLKEENLNVNNLLNEANTIMKNGNGINKQLEMEVTKLKEMNESVSIEICNANNSLANKEQFIMKLINENKEKEATIIEKQNIIERKEEKINIAEKTEMKELSELELKISSLDKEKEKIESKYAERIKALEENMKLITEENESLKNDAIKVSVREEDKHIDLNGKSEVQKLRSNLESSDQLIAEQTAQIVILEEEIKLNNSCLKNIDKLRTNLEIAWKDLTTEKAKNIKYEMQNTDDNKTIKECKNDLTIYKEKVLILEKKVKNIQALGKLQPNQTKLSLELVSIKEMLAEEKVKAQSTSEEKNNLNIKLEDMEKQIDVLKNKTEKTKHFDDDTIKNLKEKIKLKDETIKLLTDENKKYWPQKVENLNHIISVKREKFVSKSGSDVEGTVVPSLCASNAPNQNEFFELNEKLAENEDFIKSLTTILKAKDEQIDKLKQEIERPMDSKRSRKPYKPAEKRPLEHNPTKEQNQEIKKKRTG